jgi:hypothetical protein
MTVIVGEGGSPVYQSEVHTHTHKTYLGKVWILNYQRRLEGGVSFMDYWYINPSGQVVYDSRKHGKPLLNAEEEWLFQDFRALIFHRESQLFSVEIETEKVVVEKRVVKGAIQKGKR